MNTRRRTKRRLNVDVSAANSLNIGLYQGKTGYAVYATWRRPDGEMEHDVYMAAGPSGWELLDTALDELRLVKARQCIIFTNSKKIAEALENPRTPPKPDKVKHTKSFGKVQWGGNVYHWNVLRCLTAYCAGNGFKIVRVGGDQLKRARELYEHYRQDYQPGEVTQCQASRYRSLQPCPPAAPGEAERWFNEAPLLAF